jgi:hypothetical protein
VSNAGPTVPTDLGPARGPGGVDSQLDPELVALHAPPQGQRLVSLTVMAAAVVAAMALVFSLSGDMRYAISRPQPLELGNARQLEPTALTSNSYVHIKGIPTVARSVRFTRGLGSQYRVFPLAGQPHVFVQIADKGGESFVRSEFSGRMVSFDDLGGRYADLVKVMERDAGLVVGENSFVLLADEQPSASLWAWVVGVLCAAFVVLDVFFIVRWFKPVKWTEVE